MPTIIFGEFMNLQTGVKYVVLKNDPDISLIDPPPINRSKP